MNENNPLGFNLGDDTFVITKDEIGNDKLDRSIIE